MAKSMQLTTWVRGNEFANGIEAEVINVKPHDACRETVVYAIKHKNGKEVIIEEAGIESISKKTTKILDSDCMIIVDRKILNEYYEAATYEQRVYLADNFKLSGETTVGAIQGLHSIACCKWKDIIKANHPECFVDDKDFDLSYLAPSREYPNIFTDEWACWNYCL